MGEPAHPDRTATPADPESGFTIIEVMVAMVILLIGVLGTLTVLTGSYASTGATTAREQGTNLARDLVERSHQVPFSAMSQASAGTTLRSTLAADAPADNVPPSASSFRVTRRGTTYTVTVTACSIDDPTDGAGIGDATFCAAPSGSDSPGSATPGTAIGLNVLGVGVTVPAGSPLIDTVCNAVGINSALLSAVSSVLDNVLSAAGGATLSVCPGGTQVALDTNAADDLRRVRVTVDWSRAGGGAVAQTTLLTNPDQG